MDSNHSQFWWQNTFTFGVIESDGDGISDWKDSLATEPLGADGRRELKIRVGQQAGEVLICGSWLNEQATLPGSATGVI